MSRAPYQKLGNGPAASSAASSRPPTAKSPKEQQSADKHRARNVESTDNDPQAPWLTNLEYSVDPLLWDDDNKYKACPLCQQAFVVTLMGSGKHHCRMCGTLCCGPCSRGALDLPGYDSEERVCEVCRKRVLGLRNFLAKNVDTLTNNMHHNRDSVKFELYHAGRPSWETQLWLSQSLLLVMWKDRDDQYQGVPVNQIDSIGEGFSTQELLSRKSKKVMCCIASEDEMFAAKQQCLFSLLLSDGRTLDFEAPTPALRGEWVDRLRGLLTHTSSFVQYHMEVAQYKLHELISREKARLSIENVRKEISKQKAAARGPAATKQDLIKQKYQRK